jgi:Glycosyl transferases group 1/DUF based on E. rectale Gene description (DUF3880)
MHMNIVGAFLRNAPFGTEIAFAKGLREYGIQVNAIDDSVLGQKWNYDADVTLVFKTMQRYWTDLAQCGGIKIVYQPDDMRFPHIQKMMRDMRDYCSYALTFDDDGAKKAMEMGYKKAKRLLLTADPDLYRPWHKKVDLKPIDVCFVGSLTQGANHRSRVRMLELLKETKLFKVGYMSDMFDIRRIVDAYTHSKIVLNHATDVGQPFGHGYGYQCRHFEAGFTRACVLSNVVDNENAIKNFETFSSEQELVHKCNILLQYENRREQLAEGLFQELNKSHRPVHRAQEIVEFVRSIACA